MTRRRGATAEPSASELAQARERDRKAVQLALAGADYGEIAEQLGYADRSGAWRAVRRALHRAEATDVAALRAQEAARLDRLQAGLWAKAVRGDAQAAMAALRVIDRRCRLLGLDAPTQVRLGPIPVDLTDPTERVQEAIAVREELRALLPGASGPPE